jgi:hypothetical protein
MELDESERRKVAGPCKDIVLMLLLWRDSRT